jgi:hypothetical protein
MRTAPPTVPGIAQPNSTPDSPPHHRGQRRPAAARDGIAVAVDRGQLAREPHHQTVEAGVGRQQVRAQAYHRHLDALGQPPAQQVAQLAGRLRPSKVGGRPASAHRRQPRDRDVALDERRRLRHTCSSSMSPTRRTSPAPIVTTMSPRRMRLRR